MPPRVLGMSWCPPGARPAFVALCVGLLVCALWVPVQGLELFARGDVHVYFVPELEMHLNGDHAFGPALWNPHVQLGRPATHFGGLSQAYWLNHLFSWALDDAWRAHTALVLATLVLGGLLAWALFRTLDLHPWASAACALGFAFAPFHGYAGHLLCYVGGSTWMMGLSWALVRNLRACTVANGLLMAFVVHSAILGSYPQQLVWAGWLGLFLLVALMPPRGQRARALLALSAWTAVGVLSAAPFQLDLFDKIYASSGLTGSRPIVGTQPLEGMRDALTRLREVADPLWNGRKPYSATPHHLLGGSFTPFFGAAVLLALTAVRTRLVRCIGVFLLAALVLSLSSSAFRFAGRYLGLGFSSFHPFTALTGAVLLLAAVGFDHVLRVPGGKWRALLALVLPALLGSGALAAALPLDPLNVGVSLALAGCAAFALAAPAGPWVTRSLALGALACAIHYGVLSFSVAHREGIAERIRWQAPLAAEVERRAQGGRFAWVSEDRPQLLGANTEEFYGLASIHSYDSMASLRYQAWMERITEGTESIRGVSRLASEEFARAGVRVVLARDELRSPVLAPAGKTRQVHVHDVVAPGPLEAWVPLDACELADGAARIPAPIARVGEPVERRAPSNERIELALEPRAEPGVLWLSQQFHPRWRARAGGEALATVPVDGFWQGVVVPPGTGAVVLEFRPWLRWWWVPQAAFAALALAFVLRKAARARLAAR